MLFFLAVTELRLGDLTTACQATRLLRLHHHCRLKVFTTRLCQFGLQVLEPNGWGDILGIYRVGYGQILVKSIEQLANLCNSLLQRWQLLLQGNSMLALSSNLFQVLEAEGLIAKAFPQTSDTVDKGKFGCFWSLALIIRLQPFTKGSVEVQSSFRSLVPCCKSTLPVKLLLISHQVLLYRS